MASTMLMQGLVVAYWIVAAVSAGEGNWARCLYWMCAAGITIAVLWGSK